MIPSPFRGSWCATDLGNYRPCPFTYERYPMESLPPLDEASFVGDFPWCGDIGSVLDEPDAEMAFDNDPAYEIYWCAPTTEIFAYRFWTENTLWYALHGDQSIENLNEDQLAYLNHYTPTK